MIIDKEWIQKGQDIVGTNVCDRSGYAVSLSKDGTTVAIAAIESSGSGKVIIYKNNNLSYLVTDWEKIGEIIKGIYIKKVQGYSVSLSQFGDTLAIGSYGIDENYKNIGFVRVFEYNYIFKKWMQKGNTIVGECFDDRNGYSISLSYCGCSIAVGAIGNLVNYNRIDCSGNNCIDKDCSDNYVICTDCCNNYYYYGDRDDSCDCCCSICGKSYCDCECNNKEINGSYFQYYYSLLNPDEECDCDLEARKKNESFLEYYEDLINCDVSENCFNCNPYQIPIDISGNYFEYYYNLINSEDCSGSYVYNNNDNSFMNNYFCYLQNNNFSGICYYNRCYHCGIPYEKCNGCNNYHSVCNCKTNYYTTCYHCGNTLDCTDCSDNQYFNCYCCGNLCNFTDCSDNDCSGNLSTGFVRVFEFKKDCRIWQQVGDDIKGENKGDQTGYSVSLSYKGEHVAIGSIGYDLSGNNKGQVIIYKKDTSDNWAQIGNDIVGDNECDQSGYSVSLSQYGNRVAIGANTSDGNGINSGSVKVFEYNDPSDNWFQMGRDIYGRNKGDQSGFSVSLSSDGKTVAIGSIYNSDIEDDNGLVRVYSYSDIGFWYQVGGGLYGENEGDEFGYSVSLSGDGDTVAIGSPFNDDNGNDTGCVKVFISQKI